MDKDQAETRALRVLIVGLNYAPEEIGIGPYTAGLAEALAERGMSVRVIAGRPYYPVWAPFEGSSRIWRRKREKGVLVTRSPHYIPARPSGARRILHHASFTLSAFLPTLASALRRRPDVVVAIAPSFLAGPIAWLSARANRAIFWLHIQDFELEAAFATGLLKPDGAASRAALGLEHWLLAHADVVSSISPQMCRHLAEKGVPAERIYELRNWSNHWDRFEQPAAVDYRALWGLGDRVVALYSGNIANKQGLELVVEAARALRSRDDIVFVVCGNGPNRERLETLALGLDNIQFHDLQPAEHVADLLTMADMHLLPQLASAADLVLPSKLTNMLASGRPVVATAHLGTGLHDEVEGCGIAVEPDDPAALAAAIRTLANDQDLRAAYGRAARARARERWSRDGILDALAHRIHELVAARRARSGA